MNLKCEKWDWILLGILAYYLWSTHCQDDLKHQAHSKKQHIKTAFKFLYMGYDGGIAID